MYLKKRSEWENSGWPLFAHDNRKRDAGTDFEINTGFASDLARRVARIAQYVYGCDLAITSLLDESVNC